jgi:hypothetical protein
MIDEERRFALKTFTELYAQNDFNVLVQHMPKEISDPEGVLFNDYFDFLQSFYALLGEYPVLEEDQVFSWAESLKAKAKRFGFPATNLDYL